MPKEDLLCAVRQMMDAALRDLVGEFGECYARRGRPSFTPNKLLRAQLLQVPNLLRSERQSMGQLDYNLLLRWPVGLSIDDPVSDVMVFTKNRERLIEGEVEEQLLLSAVEQARTQITARRCRLRPFFEESTGGLLTPSPFFSGLLEFNCFR